MVNSLFHHFNSSFFNIFYLLYFADCLLNIKFVKILFYCFFTGYYIYTLGNVIGNALAKTLANVRNSLI